VGWILYLIEDGGKSGYIVGVLNVLERLGKVLAIYRPCDTSLWFKDGGLRCTTVYRQARGHRRCCCRHRRDCRHRRGSDGGHVGASSRDLNTITCIEPQGFDGDDVVFSPEDFDLINIRIGGAKCINIKGVAEQQGRDLSIFAPTEFCCSSSFFPDPNPKSHRTPSEHSVTLPTTIATFPYDCPTLRTPSPPTRFDLLQLTAHKQPERIRAIHGIRFKKDIAIRHRNP
jgi:hypothetical protein